MTTTTAKKAADTFQGSSQDPFLYMTLALDEARKCIDEGEVPVGAVVVYEPIDKQSRKPMAPAKIVGTGRNSREQEKDATAHAELKAMREAMHELGAWRLSYCTVYVTMEPCIMCAGLMQQARIARCVYGAKDPKGGAVESLYRIGDDSRLNHSFDVLGGVMEEDCSSILSNFFRERRCKK